MPTSYNNSSSPSFTRFRRSILSMKHDRVVHSIDNQTHESFIAQEHDLEFESFQKLVTQKFHDLSLVESHEFLSVSWVSKLLDVFICCQEEFRVILSNNKSYLSKHPMEKSVLDYFERSVKGLDVCNAIRDGIEEMRQWQKQLEIVLCALEDQSCCLGEAQFQRAKRALNNLDIRGMGDEKESSSNLANRNQSFGRNFKDLEHQGSKCLNHSRSSSWSVLRSWSSSKQLQAIGNNIVVPKNSEIIATNGLVLVVYTMSHVMSFLMWTLVATIPRQNRGLRSHFNTPKNFAWGVLIFSLQERILEESKKRDRKNVWGLLKEIHMIEIYTKHINECIDSVRFPLDEKQKAEVKRRYEELGFGYEALKNGLDPLEKQVKEVFHRIIRCRVEGLDSVTR